MLGFFCKKDLQNDYGLLNNFDARAGSANPLNFRNFFHFINFTLDKMFNYSVSLLLKITYQHEVNDTTVYYAYLLARRHCHGYKRSK